MNNNMQDKWKNSYLFGGNADFIEELYDNYLDDPASVDPKWVSYFNSIQDGTRKDALHSEIKEKFSLLTQKPIFSQVSGGLNDAQAQVWRYVVAYRTYGMAYADLDPLQRRNKPKPAELELSSYGLTDQLENEFYVDLDILNSEKLKLKDIVAKFDKIYTEHCGFEFGHISDLSERAWLHHYVEEKYLSYKLDSEEKIQLLQKLTEADGLERFLHTKYVGQKRFSLEGGDALIPALDRVIKTGAKNGLKEVVIGMAHRGRLNCLVNIAGKAPQKLFDEFDGNYPTYDFVTSGDVKYHKGYKCNYATPYGSVKTTLAFNPSHLEVVNPVVNGIVRARQDEMSDTNSILGVLIHGDSALIGLGTNQGVLNMSYCRAYDVMGMLHIVVNNQIGFTTSDVRDTRSSRYCTDIAKMIESPIIHVNGDDLESVAFVMDLAVDYRTKYKKDLFVDLVCFRRHGHNEADDPTLTQPYMYSLVKKHPGTRRVYAEKLIAEGLINQETVDKMFEDYRDGLTRGEHIFANNMEALKWYTKFDTAPVLKAKFSDKINTAISIDEVNRITEAVTTLPDDANFKPHPTVARLIETRKAMGRGEQAVDFGMAETLAYGSLLNEGISIRMTGEDACRGTFTHRQAVWHNLNRTDVTDCGFMPLVRLENNSKIRLYDSILNEECVLGFEYGYSTTRLRDLVIWEAQFGDFANGAQVIIDQFIVSGEVKWGTLSNLTLMLPHGYDGQGPEHSSARVERFLQLCAENNIQVIMPSTAAQMFHLLRRKALTNWIKPTVIFMSKRLLRYKDAMSLISSFTSGEFQMVIEDNLAEAAARKVVVCSGQVYYDIYNERANRQSEKNVAIIRLEQLYPFPTEELKAQLAKYKHATSFVWAQEEPYNQGAWLQIRDNLDHCLGGKDRFKAVTRPAAAAPACGLATIHNKESKQILEDIFI